MRVVVANGEIEVCHNTAVKKPNADKMIVVVNSKSCSRQLRSGYS